MNKATLILAVILVSTGIWAQSPQGFNYQTVVRDNTGEAITSQAVSFRISILENGMTGTNIYSEIQNTFTNEFGLATFVIGQGASLNGDFSTIEWGQNEHFVQIELDASGSTNYQMMGTSQLMSVPYALNAAHAENVFSGEYGDLTNTPAIPSNVSELNNDAGFITDPNDADNNPTNELQFLTLFGDSLYISNSNHITLPKRFSGNWIDLIGVPANIDLNMNDDFSGSWNDLTNVPPNIDWDITDDFSGSWNDLTNVPPNIDWDTTDDFSGSWNDLSNVPPNIDLDVADDFSGDFGDLTNVPSDVSYWFNDAGYLTNPDDADANPTNEIQNLSIVGDTILLSSGGQVILPPVDYSDVNNTPTNVSAFTNDVGYITDPTDADASTTNEIQSLSIVSDTIMLSSGGQVVLPTVDYADVNNTPTNVSAFTNDVGYITDPTDADASTTNEIQTLSIVSDTITLSSGGQVVLPTVDYADVNNTPTNVSAFTNDVGYITDPTDADASTTNEIQAMTISNDTISLTSGGQVVLPTVDYADVNNTPTNVSAFTNDAGYITDPTDADASTTNELQTISKSGSIVTLSNGGGSYLDAVDDADPSPTNEHNISGLVVGNSLLITDGGGTLNIDMSSFSDADQSPTNEIQTISIIDDTISLTSGGQVILPPVDYTDVNNTPTNVSAFTNDAGYITDPTDADASTTNEIQTLSIVSDTIMLSSGGQVVLPTVDYADVNNTPTNVSAFMNDAGYITNPNDADTSTTNEIQTMTISNDTISLTSGGQVVIPAVDYADVNNTPTNVSTFMNDAGYITNPNDADTSTTNEIQTITISNDTISLTSGGQVVIPAVDYADVNNTPTNVSDFTNDAGYVTSSSTNTLANKTLNDNTTLIQDDVDNTKKVQFQLSGVSTATTRTLFVPDANSTIVGTDISQTITNKTIDATNNTISNLDNSSIKIAAAIDASKLANGTVSNTELQYINSVTSNVQTQLNTKITASSTATMTNKTIDADSNTVTNIDNSAIKAAAAIDATKMADGSVTNAEFQYLGSVTSDVQAQLDNKISAVSSSNLKNKTIDADSNTVTNIDNSAIKAAAAIDATKMADGSVTNAEFQYLGSVTSDVQAQLDNKISAVSSSNLKNKTIDADSNTVTNIDNSAIKAAAAIDATKMADGSVTNAEFQYLGSVTSDVQAQLDNKISAVSSSNMKNKTIDADSNTVTNIDNSAIKAAAAIDATKMADGSVTNAEFQYINTVTSNVQTQLNSKISASSTATLTNKNIDDATTLFQDNLDNTKQVQFQLSGITTGNTRVISFPDATTTLVGTNTTQTMTNKSINADNNTISNLDNADIKASAAIDATKMADGSVSNTEFQYIGTVTSNVQTQLNNKISASSTATLTNKNIDDATTLIQDNLDNTKQIQFQLSGLTTGNTRVISFPDASTTLVGTNATQTMTNKSIDADNNTITNIDNADIKASAAIDAAKVANGSVSSTEYQYLANVTSDIQTQLDNKITASSTSTLTNKTMTDATTFMQDNTDNTKKVQFQLSGITTSTTRTITVPDANTTMVGTNATQTMTNKSIDADNNTITNIDNADIKASAAIDAAKVANGSVSSTEYQYLANVTSDIQTQLDNKITATSTSTLTNKTMTDATTYMQDNVDNTKKVQFQLSGLSTSTTRIITIPDVDMTLVGLTATQTVTNKTFTNVGSIAIGAASITPSVALEVTSTSGAVLFPRMTTVQRGLLTPVNGMVIYVTDGTPGFYGYSSGAWVLLN
ncbi:MAG: hypothetical protein HKN92_10215 [Chitinophagales bacterium]|nr:hypothetical protein [Chitinophagales bacterium]